MRGKLSLPSSSGLSHTAISNSIHILISQRLATRLATRWNIFKHENRDKAIDQNGYCGFFGDNITKPIDVRPNNSFDVDPTTQRGSCDLFGDGQQDESMATGVTWWTRSPVTGQWRYLNTMPERLSELQLGKINSDAVCDVAPRSGSPFIPPEKYSKCGTGPLDAAARNSLGVIALAAGNRLLRKVCA